MMYRNYIFPVYMPGGMAEGERFLHGSNRGFRAVATVEPGNVIRADQGALVTHYSGENNTFYNILNFLNKEGIEAYITAAEAGDLTKKRTIGALSQEEKNEMGKRVVGADSINERARLARLWDMAGHGGKRRHRRNAKKTGKKHMRRRGTRKH